MQEPWVVLTIVVLLAACAFVVFRRLGGDSRLRVELLHSLTNLADSESAFYRRHGYYAARIGTSASDSMVTLRDSSGAQLAITHIDSLGWTATGFNPYIRAGVNRCYVYGGGITAHDSRLTNPGVAKCW